MYTAEQLDLIGQAGVRVRAGAAAGTLVGFRVSGGRGMVRVQPDQGDEVECPADRLELDGEIDFERLGRRLWDRAQAEADKARARRASA